MWQAHEEIWPRHAPVLFPVVGKLRHGKIMINGQEYEMGQHGFARDLEFEMVELYTDLMRFKLVSTPETRKMFPYDFQFFITYEAADENIKITYNIVNTGDERMYYSVGAHPAFNLPGKDLSSFRIEFERDEDLDRHLLTAGLFNGDMVNIGSNTRKLQLGSELFANDAIVLKNLRSTYLALVQPSSNFKIGLLYRGFSYMGIWTKHPYEEFLCLEPWNGLADYEWFGEDISLKEGILTLAPHKEASFSYTLSFTAP